LPNKTEIRNPDKLLIRLAVSRLALPAHMRCVLMLSADKDFEKRRGKGNKIARGTHMILDGAFFSRYGNGWLKVFFVPAVIGLFYISNNYLAEKKIRKIEKSQVEISGPN
jgi:hypothetical protein